jgi:hypothetical protein
MVTLSRSKLALFTTSCLVHCSGVVILQFTFVFHFSRQQVAIDQEGFLLYRPNFCLFGIRYSFPLFYKAGYRLVLLFSRLFKVLDCQITAVAR